MADQANTPYRLGAFTFPGPVLGLRFITEQDFGAWLIRAESHGYYSHVDIILPDGTYLGARIKGGVLIRQPDYIESVEHGKVSRERRYAIPYPQAKLDVMMAFAHSQVGKPYDKIDIFGIGFNQRSWKTDDAWICSELGFCVPAAANEYLINVDEDSANVVTPDMLHLSPRLMNHCFYHTENGVRII